MAGILQHLRSSTLDKRPNPASMVDGQVAINYASGAPGMFFKNSNGDLVKVGPVHVGSSAPNASPASGGTAGNSIGEQWLDNSGGTYVFKIWDGSAWRSEAGEFVNTTGDTMTGALILPSGTAAVPALGVGSTDNGLYSPGTDQVALVTNGTERLFVAANGNVGIGGSPTSAKLYVNGTVLSDTITTSGALQVTRSSSTKTLISDTGSYFINDLSAGSFIPTASAVPTNGMYLPSANSVALATNGTGRLFIDSSGSVGIGTSSVTGTNTQLEVAGGTATELKIGSSSANNANFRGLRFGITGDSNNYSGILFKPSTAELQLEAGYSGFGGFQTFYTNGSERLRITSDGKVGVGTSSPTNILHVVGTSSTPAIFDRTDTTGTFISLKDSASQTFIGNTNGVFSIQTPGSSYSDKLVVTSGGLVGVGTTAPSGNLDVRGLSGTSIIRAVGADSNGNADVEIVSTGTTGNSRLYFADTAAQSGSIIYSHSNNSFAFATNGGGSDVVIDSSGRLGVGTSSPSSLLHVQTGNFGSVQIQDDGGSQYASKIVNPVSTIKLESTVSDVILSSARHFRFEDEAGSALARLTSDGRLGIGTTSPGSKLEVSGSSNASELRLRSTDTSNATIRSYVNSLEAGKIAFTSGRELFIETAGAERVRIDSSGRLLVGTSSTSATGTIFAQGSSSSTTGPSYLYLQRGQAAGASIGNGTSIGVINFADNASGVFAQIAAEGDAPSSSGDYPGRLVFSTTADGQSSPTVRHQLDNKGNTRLFCNATSDSLYPISAAAAGTSRWLIYGIYGATSITTGGTASFGVYTNGNVVNTNNSYGTLSDIKLKENIADASSQWDDIKAIRICNFNLKEGQTHRQIGVIAQEVELVSPGLVYETPDRDEEGNETGDVTKGVNYSVLYIKAIKALQEAMERIETLEQRLSDAGIA
jgi:hypothetical protein